MGRKVDTGWYDVYVTAKGLERSLDANDPSIPVLASQLGLKPRTLARIRSAGNFLNEVMPEIQKDQIQCGYAALEELARLWSVNPKRAKELLQGVLANRVKLPELEDAIRGGGSPTTATTKIPRRELIAKMDKWLESSELIYFDAFKGKAFKVKSRLGTLPTYLVLDRNEKANALVICKKGAGWRDPAIAARELYDYALARRHSAAVIWFVFENDNATLQHLAELSAWWGGSPCSEKPWLFLAHFDESGRLEVLYEEYFANLICKMREGNAYFQPSDLVCTAEQIGDGLETIEIGLAETTPISIPNKPRAFSEVIRNRILALAKTNEAPSSAIETMLGIDLGL